MTTSNGPLPDNPVVSKEHSPPGATKSRNWPKAIAIVSLVFAIGAFGLSGAALLVSLGRWPDRPPSGDFEAQAQSYIKSHPEVIVESVSQMETRQKAAEENELTALLSTRRDEIFNDPSSPVGGNAAGDATLVEFFDYNCPYCRQVAPILDRLQQSDHGLRVVYKEFPILGPGSVFAARAALASQKQGKYLAFHDGMLAFKGAITESSTLEVAANVGLDVDRLKADMADPAIEETIKRNLALANDLRVSGTPTFVTDKRIRPGLLDIDAMRRLIADARQKAP